jgi:hypothetical protein
LHFNLDKGVKEGWGASDSNTSFLKKTKEDTGRGSVLKSEMCEQPFKIESSAFDENEHDDEKETEFVKKLG